MSEKYRCKQIVIVFNPLSRKAFSYQGAACRGSFNQICNLIFPRPLRERVQSCLSRAAKATNAGVGVKTIIHEYPPTVSDHFPLKGGRCLRLQSTSFVFPCPLGESGQIHPTYCVILSPITIQVRRIFKTLQKGDSEGFRPQNDGTLVSLAFALPKGAREYNTCQI